MHKSLRIINSVILLVIIVCFVGALITDCYSYSYSNTVSSYPTKRINDIFNIDSYEILIIIFLLIGCFALGTYLNNRATIVTFFSLNLIGAIYLLTKLILIYKESLKIEYQTFYFDVGFFCLLIIGIVCFIFGLISLINSAFNKNKLA